jgi:multiple sugar transport system permease protein
MKAAETKIRGRVVNVARPSGFFRSRLITRWALIAPCLTVLLGFSIFPLLYSLRLSVLRWDIQIPGQEFVGLGNYLNLLSDAEFRSSLAVTAIIVLGAVAVEALFGLALALILAGSLPGRRFLIPLFTLPVTVAPVVVAFTWKLMFDAQYGPVNQFIGWIVNRDVQFDWLNHVSTSIIAVIVADVWQWTPFVFLVVLAGLMALPGDLFEAAAVDGASPLRQLLHLTLPLLRPVLGVTVLIRSLDAVKFFDIVYAMTHGGPGTSTETVSFYIYRTGFQYFRMGYTAAATYILLAIVSVLASVYLSRVAREMS